MNRTMPTSPQSTGSLLADNSLSEVPDARHKTQVSRHRRVFKEVGAITGLTLVDHPKGNGVVVSALTEDGACKRSGVRVGDHISKINGERPASRDHAVALIDNAWTAVADGEDKNKDRLKFSLHLRAQEFSLGRQTSGLSAGALVGVEVLGSSGKPVSSKSLLGGGKKVEDAGITLEDSPTELGALITNVASDSPADVAGLEAGMTIVSVDETLCPGSHKEVLKMINAARSKKGIASLVVHLKKDKNDEAEHI